MTKFLVTQWGISGEQDRFEVEADNRLLAMDEVMDYFEITIEEIKEGVKG